MAGGIHSGAVMSAEPSVLLVEDEENVAYVVALALRHSGFEVRVVGTGSEALSISSSNPMPDIVVLDVMLPDLDGFEVCRRMRADQNDLPVLFLTARDASSGPTARADDRRGRLPHEALWCRRARRAREGHLATGGPKPVDPAHPPWRSQPRRRRAHHEAR
jgi:CheY-like chemotaxis protein